MLSFHASRRATRSMSSGMVAGFDFFLVVMISESRAGVVIVDLSSSLFGIMPAPNPSLPYGTLMDGSKETCGLRCEGCTVVACSDLQTAQSSQSPCLVREGATVAQSSQSSQSSLSWLHPFAALCCRNAIGPADCTIAASLRDSMTGALGMAVSILKSLVRAGCMSYIV